MDNSEYARVNAGDQVPGYIFMCNSKTKPDCFVYRVFGLPASRIVDVENIKPNTKLFLFDFDVKLLYGPYVADSSGKLAIEPYAFGGRFPAQVKFSIMRDCLPLPEVAFKEAIRENYYGGSKFKQNLTEEQVNKLVSLFRPITLPSPPRLPSSVFHTAVEIQHPGHRGSSFQITKSSSYGQYAAGSDRINMQLYHSPHVQEVPFPHLRLAHNQVALAGNHSHPFHSQPSCHQHDSAFVNEIYHPDHLRLYQHDTHARYMTLIPQIASANSYYAPNPMPQSHISAQQSQPVARSSAMAAAQWVAIASEAQSPGGQTSIPRIPSSSNEVQLPCNDYYGQSQSGRALPQTPSLAVDNAYMYYNSMRSTTLTSEYQYQGYQASHQPVHSIASVEVSGNFPAQVSKMHPTYQSSVPPNYSNQEQPVSHFSAAGVSAHLGAGYVPTYYAGANPTY